MLGNTLTIVIRNTNPTAQHWSAFGFNEGAVNPQGVTVSIVQSSAAQATRESATEPFVIDTIKIKAPNNPSQMDQPIIIHAKDSTGKLFEVGLTPSEYASPTNNSPTFVEVKNANIEIKGNVALQGSIEGNTTMTIIITITKKKIMSAFINTIANIFGSSNIKISYKITPGTRIIIQ